MLAAVFVLPVCLSLAHAQTHGWQPHNTWSELPARREGQRLSEQPNRGGLRVSRPSSVESSGSASRPRRGRIVARIHSSDLSIPALHSHYINNKQPIHTFPTFAQCSELCPPQWMNYVNKLQGLTENVTKPMCAFSEQFSACSVENGICRNDPVPFRCCPSHCVQSAMACYNGPPTDFLCVPKTIQPWMRKMVQLIALG